MKSNPWGMEDSDFWDPQSEKAEMAREDNEQPAFHEDWSHRHYLEIGVPSELRLGEHETLPLVLVMGQSNYDSWVFSTDYRANVWAINLDTNEHRVSGLESIDHLIWEFDWSYQPSFGSGAMSTQVIDLFEMTEIPRQEGSWIVRVINHHIVSNPVVVRIIGDKPSPSVRPAPTPVSSSLSYPECAEPSHPVAIGIEIVAPPVVTTLNEKVAVISIRFALPLREGQRYEDETGEPMAVVTLKLDSAGIMVFPDNVRFGGKIHAPAKIVASPSGESVAYGQVDIKLWEIKRKPNGFTEQQIQLYVFSGQYLGGPTQIQFGEKSVVPPPPLPGQP